jgi:hypothetical protein
VDPRASALTGSNTVKLRARRRNAATISAAALVPHSILMPPVEFIKQIIYLRESNHGDEITAQTPWCSGNQAL